MKPQRHLFAPTFKKQFLYEQVRYQVLSFYINTFHATNEIYGFKTDPSFCTGVSLAYDIMLKESCPTIY
jgi:hypothetical protein